jgi:farnesyl-diphosphate farnesyltransferase
LVEAAAREGLEHLQAEIVSPSEAERVLIRQIPACLEWLESVDEFDRAQIRAVLKTIIRGQSLDLERFGSPGAVAVIALPTAAELDEYTYLVAGCVGEFWTRICAHHVPRYSALPAESLAQIGIRFGQGLQLVNILRDLPEDLRQGRCYLPADELHAAGLSPDALRTNPGAARPVFQRWLARAHEHLAQGAEYVRSIRPARVRLACFLPWHLGVKTLTLLEQHDPLTSPHRLKVPRSEVTRTFVLGLWAAFSDQPVKND